jgi:hypothetical protein
MALLIGLSKSKECITGYLAVLMSRVTWCYPSASTDTPVVIHSKRGERGRPFQPTSDSRT